MLDKMDDIFEFLEKIRNDNRINGVRYSQHFLDEVARILSLRGFDDARLFLWDSLNREDVQGQINSILITLSKMESVKNLKNDLKLCGYIIRNKMEFIR